MGTTNPRDIIIEEQGPRDGFQSVEQVLSTEAKIEIIEALAACGVSRIQICSFVHPRLVPQMADAEALCSQLPRKAGVLYSGLALNEKGVERAVAAGLDHLAASISVSDAHSLKNTRMPLADARVLDLFAGTGALGLEALTDERPQLEAPTTLSETQLEALEALDPIPLTEEEAAKLKQAAANPAATTAGWPL